RPRVPRAVPADVLAARSRQGPYGAGPEHARSRRALGHRAAGRRRANEPEPRCRWRTAPDTAGFKWKLESGDAVPPQRAWAPKALNRKRFHLGPLSSIQPLRVAPISFACHTRPLVTSRHVSQPPP